MAKILFKVSGVLLLVLLGLHIFAAMTWGNWDPEGTGSSGFRTVSSLVVVRFAWLYGILVVTTVVSWYFSRK